MLCEDLDTDSLADALTLRRGPVFFWMRGLYLNGLPIVLSSFPCPLLHQTHFTVRWPSLGLSPGRLWLIAVQFFPNIIGPCVFDRHWSVPWLALPPPLTP